MDWHTLKIVLRLVWRSLLCLSFGVMIALGLLMAYGLVPGIRGGRMAEVIEWRDFARSASDGSLGKIFFSLAAINLVLVWGWLIHCAARLDFLRLAAGLLTATAIIVGLLFLTPAYCSRSPDLTKAWAGFEIPRAQHPGR
ncbi:MAG TPA: hypothetical protein VFS35_09285 [Terrimicrobiaceae bacterium]|nr:hypothetical protein [Terrimicrobiaceae bacterium]